MESTNLSKYGVTSTLSAPDIISRRLETNQKKYGGKSPMSSNIIKEKVKETTKQRYGVDHVFQNDEIKQKIKNHYQTTYGVDNNNHVPAINTKRQTTNILKYGAITPFHSESIQKNIKSKIQQKYGRDHVNQRHIDIDVLKISKDDLEKLNKDMNILEISKYLNVSYDWVINKFRQYNIETIIHRSSIVENSIENLLDNNQIVYTKNNRNIISPREVDFYLPHHGIALEINGSYWHSEINGKDHNYHLSKTEDCQKINIQLIHIWEHLYKKDPGLMDSIILSKLGIYSNRYYARNFQIVRVGAKEKNDFLDQYHIQKSCNSSINFGLAINEKLYAVMTFGKSRFNKNYEWELLRFCSIKNTQIIGGASRLFKQFVNLMKPTNVISYADRNLSSGKMYSSLGFDFDGYTSPCFWVTNDYKMFYHRVKFQKHKLDKILNSFDSNQSAWVNLKNNGYDRIWDTGTTKWVWNYK